MYVDLDKYYKCCINDQVINNNSVGKIVDNNS